MNGFELDEFAVDAVRTEVRKLATEFPLLRYTRPAPVGIGVPV